MKHYFRPPSLVTISRSRDSTPAPLYGDLDKDYKTKAVKRLLDAKSNSSLSVTNWRTLICLLNWWWWW